MPPLKTQVAIAEGKFAILCQKIKVAMSMAWLLVCFGSPTEEAYGLRPYKCGFESHSKYHYGSVAQLEEAHALEACKCEFESRLNYQYERMWKLFK